MLLGVTGQRRARSMVRLERHAARGRPAEGARDRQPHLHRRRRRPARRRRRPHREVGTAAWASPSSRCCPSTAASRTTATSGGSWTCLAGFGLGLFGWDHCTRRRRRRRRGAGRHLSRSPHCESCSTCSGWCCPGSGCSWPTCSWASLWCITDHRDPVRHRVVPHRAVRAVAVRPHRRRRSRAQARPRDRQRLLVHPVGHLAGHRPCRHRCPPVPHDHRDPARPGQLQADPRLALPAGQGHRVRQAVSSLRSGAAACPWLRPSLPRCSDCRLDPGGEDLHHERAIDCAS